MIETRLEQNCLEQINYSDETMAEWLMYCWENYGSTTIDYIDSFFAFYFEQYQGHKTYPIQSSKVMLSVVFASFLDSIGTIKTRFRDR